MSKGSKTQTVTQQTEIPDFLQPFVQNQAATGNRALERLEGRLSGAGADELVAGLDPLQMQAQQQAIDLAGGGGGFIPTAQDTLMRTAQGDFLFGGEGFDAAVDAAVRAAQPHVLSTFGGAGRGTGGLAQAAIAQQATDAFASQFGRERQNQLAAASALPGLGLLPSDILSQIGGQRQAQSQRELTAPITAQETLLQAAGGGIPLGSLLGSSSSQPLHQNTGAGLLGGGAAGAGLGAALGFSNPWTLGAFALGGGLLGGLG